MVVTLSDVQKARKAIESVVFNTALYRSRSCSELVNKNVFLKFENQQLTGSFKIRGALNKISQLSNEEKKRGIIASSAGNHAQGVALAAKYSGVKSIIVMPKRAPIVKIEATKSYGAEVILFGDIYDEAFEHAQQLQKQNNFTFVHPYDDPAVIAGQGTIGLELYDLHPEIDTVIVPIGGGGLISGIATAIKALNPKAKIFGVQAKNANSMARSFQSKALVEPLPKVVTIADGVAVKKASKEILNNYLLPLVDDVVEVSEEEIAESIVFLMERAKTVVEGAGALSLAALKKLEPNLGQNVALILSGGNIDLNIVEKVIHRGLVKTGRLIELKVAVEDKPGVLRDLTDILALYNCNILDVKHDRNQIGIELGGTTIDFLIETSGKQASESVRKALLEKGYRLL